MSRVLSYTPDALELELRRCFDCGRHWAYERFSAGSPECPVCAGKRNDDLRAEWNKNQRTIAGLKGALKRKRSKGRRS